MVSDTHRGHRAQANTGGTQMTNVIRLVQPDTESIEDILAGTKARDLECILVMGWAKDGGLYMNGNIEDPAAANFIIDLVKQRLLTVALGDEPCPITS
jgi:hypothetical protein